MIIVRNNSNTLAESILVENFKMKKLTVTRADIVSAVVKKANISRDDVENVPEIVKNVLESLLSEVSHVLKRGNSVKIPLFGTFNVLKKRERMGRNPRNRVAATISARQVVQFKASPVVKKKVQSTGQQK